MHYLFLFLAYIPHPGSHIYNMTSCFVVIKKNSTKLTENICWMCASVRYNLNFFYHNSKYFVLMSFFNHLREAMNEWKIVGCLKHLHNFFFLTRCQPCACDPMGSVNGSCHPDSGACVCKLLVTGDKCDVCQPGASHFDPENHFGCSKGVFSNTHIQYKYKSIQRLAVSPWFHSHCTKLTNCCPYKLHIYCSKMRVVSVLSSNSRK